VGEQLNPENTSDENQSGADQKRPLTAEEIEAINRSRLEIELARPRVNNDPVTQIKFEFGITSSEDADKGREKFDVFIDRWLKFPNVAPRDAALVLCMKDPICDKGQEPVKFITGVSSRDFKWMLKAFEGIVKHEKLHGAVRSRTLLDWRDLARSLWLKYHPWFDRIEQLLAQGTNTKTPASGGYDERDQTSPVAAVAQSPTPPAVLDSTDTRAPGTTASSDTEIRKRSALIKELISVWPSIERDLKDASRESSGLAKVAKQGKHGFWKIEPALVWAKQRGKITKDSAESFVKSDSGSFYANMLKQIFNL